MEELAVVELWEELAKIKKEDSETPEQFIGGLLAFVDMLIESGTLSAHQIQNAKLLKRIDFNNRRQYHHSRIIPMANYVPPINHYAQ